MSSHLERRFALLWKAHGGPLPLKHEVRFHPKRKWRFDFVHQRSKVAIEIEGGTWARGAHSRGRGYAEDCEKYNAATLLGWHVFRLTGDMLTLEHLRPIMELIHERTPFSPLPGPQAAPETTPV